MSSAKTLKPVWFTFGMYGSKKDFVSTKLSLENIVTHLSPSATSSFHTTLICVPSESIPASFHESSGFTS